MEFSPKSVVKFLKEHPLANFVIGATVATVAGAGLYELSQTTNSNNLPIETQTRVSTPVTTVPEAVKTSLGILTATGTEPPTATPTKSPEPTATPTPTLEQMALPKLKGILASLENVNPQIGELKNYIVNLNMPLESFVNPIPGRIASGEILVQDTNNPRAFTKLTFNIAFNSDFGKWRIMNLAKNPDEVLYSALPEIGVVNFAGSRRVYLDGTQIQDIGSTPTPVKVDADIAVPTRMPTAGTATRTPVVTSTPTKPSSKETISSIKVLAEYKAEEFIGELVDKGVIEISVPDSTAKLGYGKDRIVQLMEGRFTNATIRLVDRKPSSEIENASVGSTVESKVDNYVKQNAELLSQYGISIKYNTQRESMFAQKLNAGGRGFTLSW